MSAEKPVRVEAKADDIVGHATLSDGSHRPIRRSEADEIMKQIKANEARIAALMPDEAAALRMLTDAFYRLKDFGWREAIYCPKDGRTFNVIECGSSGVHVAHYEGQWPKGTWWIHDVDDLSPSRPVLFRLIPDDDAQARALSHREAE